ncbi:MAG: outer membrane beta-barrel protein [Candidatus Tectimicrobiota bacterium]
MRTKGWFKRGLLLSGLLLGCLAVLGPGGAQAQNPLGGEFTLIFGGSDGPFKTKSNFFLGGALDVPIFASDPLAGQALLGEVMVGWSRTRANRVAVSPLAAAGVPAAAVTTTEFEVTTLQVALDFKYKIDKPWAPIAPYVVLGPSFYVFLGNTSGAPLGGDFVGGIAPQPTQLQEVNFPSGQGNVEIGVNVGAGVDIHLAKRLILGAEYRYNALTREDASHGTFGGRIGLRF